MMIRAFKKWSCGQIWCTKFGGAQKAKSAPGPGKDISRRENSFRENSRNVSIIRGAKIVTGSEKSAENEKIRKGPKKKPNGAQPG
jgi:hypothetical protein